MRYDLARFETLSELRLGPLKMRSTAAQSIRQAFDEVPSLDCQKQILPGGPGPWAIFRVTVSTLSCPNF